MDAELVWGTQVLCGLGVPISEKQKRILHSAGPMDADASTGPQARSIQDDIAWVQRVEDERGLRLCGSCFPTQGHPTTMGPVAGTPMAELGWGTHCLCEWKNAYKQILHPADPIDDFVVDGAPSARVFRMTPHGEIESIGRQESRNCGRRSRGDGASRLVARFNRIGTWWRFPRSPRFLRLLPG